MNCANDKCRSALGIVRTLREAGHEAYFVGGAVRNMLLNLEPKDYDVATSARPDEVAALFPRTLMIGASFGVAVVVDEQCQTEVATFRRDGAYLDNRHPHAVHFSSAREDAKRRDFTINALFYDPVEKRVIDFVGGEQDLKDRLLRTVGNPHERFREDALRMLRAVRFAKRFDLRIDPATANAIRAHAPLLKRISHERVRDELIGMLTGPAPGDAIQLMLDLNLLQVVLPEIAAMDGVPQPPDFHPEGDVFRHTMLCLNAMKPSPAPTLALGVLLHDVGKPPTMTVTDRIRFNEHAHVGAEMAHHILRRLRVSNEERKQVVGLVKDHMRFLDAKRMRRSTLRRFMNKAHFEEDLELHRVDCVSSHGSLENYFFCIENLEELREDGEGTAPAPLVTGDDLKAMGLDPGPSFKRILGEVYDLQLEGKVTSREQALEALRTIANV